MLGILAKLKAWHRRHALPSAPTEPYEPTVLESMLMAIRADLNGEGFATPDAEADVHHARPSDFNSFDGQWSLHERVVCVQAVVPVATGPTNRARLDRGIGAA